MSTPNRGDKLIEIDSPDFSPHLHFQEFPASTGDRARLVVDSPETLTFGQSHSPQTPGTSSGLPSSPYSEGPEQPKYSIWNLEYYQQLFDVNTDQVTERILWAMVPKPGVNYLQQYIKSKPDLYGPFWICVTLVVAIAVSGNLANYLQTAASGIYQWKYNFHTVTLAGTAIFAYAWIFPSCLWAYLKYQGSINEEAITLMELLCVYGYSLAIYVPISVLWVIQIGWLQWLLVIIGTAMSGYVLVSAVWPAFRQQSKLLLALILGCHLLLAVGFMLSYFHASPSPSLDPPAVVTPAPTPLPHPVSTAAAHVTASN